MEESRLIPPESDRADATEEHLYAESIQPNASGDGTSFQISDVEDEKVQIQEKHILSSSSAFLTRPTGLLFFFLLYAALAITSWAIICILTFHPLPKGTYVNVYNQNKQNFENEDDDIVNGTRPLTDLPLRDFFENSHRWYQAAQVMEAIVALFTLSFTSYVSSKCVVAYLQNVRNRTTLRQAFALADKSWLSFSLYLNWTKFKQLRSRFTKPLFIFMAVTLLGAIIPPIQQIFVTDITIRVPSVYDKWLSPLRTVDIGDMVYESKDQISLLPVIVQQIFTSAQQHDIIPNLWIDKRTTMNFKYASDNDTSSSLQLLPRIAIDNGGTVYGQTYGNASSENPPFLTQIPAFLNTGLIKQFVPRMNSSVTYFAIDSLPSGCNEESSGFYVEYNLTIPMEYVGIINKYSLKVCSSSIEPAWNNTRDRQDMQENFYLQINLTTWDYHAHLSGTFQVQANTSMGMFELPNYANNNTPGPLLDRDPFPCHSDDCAVQPGPVVTKRYKAVKQDKNFMTQSHGVLQLYKRHNTGPLALTILALFGPESWFAEQTYMAKEHFHWPITLNKQYWEDELCSGIAPLIFVNNLVHAQGAYGMLNCINAEITDYGQVGTVPTIWLEQFCNAEGIETTFAAAVILATNAWISNPVSDAPWSLSIFSDIGMETIIPAMSTESMIIISGLWGIYLTCLFALICYALSKKAWTGSINAFTLLKIGSTLQEKMPLLLNQNENKERVLDELPGWFGDERPLEEIGRIGLGAEEPLRSNRRYEAHSSEDENLTYSLA